MAQYAKLPKLGLTMQEGTITNIRKSAGDTVAKGDVIAEFETDKITGDVESPSDGVILQMLAQAGDTVAAMAPVALIGQAGENAPDEADNSIPVETVQASGNKPAETPVQQAVTSTGWILATPLARRLARERGRKIADIRPAGSIIKASDIPAATEPEKVRATPLAKKLAADYGIDMAKVSGSGSGGRIEKDDVIAAYEKMKNAAKTPQTVQPIQTAGIERRVKMSAMRKVISKRLSQSKQTIPHVYFKKEVDAGRLMEMKDALSANGRKIGINDILLKAVAMTLSEYPEFQGRLEGDEIVYSSGVNLGMAVSLENGLIVPVIKNAQGMGLGELAGAASALIDKARNGRLTTEEYSGGTFTVSNLGKYGIDEFAAIINPPETGILAVGSILQKPAVYQGAVAARPMMSLTLSVDHRLIDGAYAAAFLKRLGEILENGYTILL